MESKTRKILATKEVGYTVLKQDRIKKNNKIQKLQSIKKKIENFYYSKDSLQGEKTSHKLKKLYKMKCLASRIDTEFLQIN